MEPKKETLKGLKDKIDTEEIKNYYGHGTHDHEGHSHDNDHKHEPVNKYRCPMNCEGDKIYDSPGNCPVCNLKLVPAGNQKQ